MTKYRMYIWEKELRPQNFDEDRAWIIFRHVRWRDRIPPLCISCSSITVIRNKRKSNNQFFYRCKECGKVFSDLTGTPFNRTHLPMSKILFLIVLLTDNIPVYRAYTALKIANTSALRYANKIKTSELCEHLTECLSGMGITANVVLKHFDPYLPKKLKYKKSYLNFL